jgi:hypothetical protein
MIRLVLAMATATKLYDAIAWYVRLIETDVELAVFGGVAGLMLVGVIQDLRWQAAHDDFSPV